MKFCSVADKDTMESGADFSHLLERAQSGDHDAIATLWRSHHLVLLNWLRSFDREGADDIASEAWIEALRGVHRFEGDEKRFRSWLFTIARRRLIDRQRRDSRRSELMAGLSADLSARDVDADVLSGLESREAVARIVAALPPLQAEIVLLRIIGGLDVAEVATVVGKKEGAVRVLQHRALRALAKTLGAGNPRNVSSEAEEV